MSRKNSLNGPDLQHRKQPIHFYASSRGSLQDVRNGYCPIDFMTSPLSYVASPSQKDLKRISPQKGNKPITLMRSPESQINVDRVMNSSVSSKYSKFASKIELLQKNLNRLNGQHQSLKDMFSKSLQLSKSVQIYGKIDRLKQKLQQSKTNKYILQKRYEARYEIIFEEYIKKFSGIKKQLIQPQSQQIKTLQSSIKQTEPNQTQINLYHSLFEQAKIKIRSIDQNSMRFLNQIQQNIKREAVQIMNKKQVQEIVQNQKCKLKNKINRIKIKLGELKCVTQYERYVEKQVFFNKQLSQLKYHHKNNHNQKISNQKQISINYLKQQMNFIGLQSLDRLTYKLSEIDSNIVTIVQNYESKKLKHKNKNNLSQQKQSNTPCLNNNFKNHYLTLIPPIKNSIFDFKYELAGLRSYIANNESKLYSFKKTNKILSQQEMQSQRLNNHNKTIKNYQQMNHSRNQSNQNGEIMESIMDLEQKIKLLQENLNFLSSNHF